jgi:dihydrofolate reductase
MSHSKAPRVYLVAAIASNGAIGVNGQLPWRLPEDLKFFKQLTLGHPVVMGRRTWESLGKALPGRKNIVVTHRAGYEAPGATVAGSLEEALALCAGEPEAYVIGGNQLFAESLPTADGLVLTEIYRDFAGDTYFPAYDRSKWKETKREAHTAADGMRFDFVRYEPAGATSTRRP